MLHIFITTPSNYYPLTFNDIASWVWDEWSDCSATCGSSATMTRSQTCEDSSGSTVSDEACSSSPAADESDSTSCNTEECRKYCVIDS